MHVCLSECLVERHEEKHPTFKWDGAFAEVPQKKTRAIFAVRKVLREKV